jgi:hypothetical protein
MGKMIQERLPVIIGTLTCAFILGGIGVVVSQAVANEKISQLETSDKKQDKIIEEGLNKIDEKQDEILNEIKKLAVEAAKYHHEHAR